MVSIWNTTLGRNELKENIHLIYASPAIALVGFLSNIAVYFKNTLRIFKAQIGEYIEKFRFIDRTLLIFRNYLCIILIANLEKLCIVFWSCL